MQIDLLTTTSFYTFNNPKALLDCQLKSIYFLRDEKIEILAENLKQKFMKKV